MKAKAITLGLLICTLISCKQEEQKKAEVSTFKGQVVEFAPISLKDSVTEEMLLKASSRLQKEFLAQQTGFIKRALVKKSDKEYVDLVYWENQARADQALQEAMNNPVCFAYFQLMKEADPQKPEDGIFHYKIVSEYQ